MTKQHVLKFLKNFDDYNEYSKKILKFIHDKGRAPEKYIHIPCAKAYPKEILFKWIKNKIEN